MPNKESGYIFERRANRRNKYDQFNSIFHLAISIFIFINHRNTLIKIYTIFKTKYIFKKNTYFSY